MSWLTTPNVDHFLDKVKKQISVHSVRAAILRKVIIAAVRIWIRQGAERSALS